MFVVECMVNRNGEIVNPCGSDYCSIIHDLKSVAGVKNRMKAWSIPNDVVRVDIYKVSNVYDRNTYKLQEAINMPKGGQIND